jgi:DNA primase
MVEMVQRISGRNYFEALRFISGKATEAPDPIDQLAKALEPEQQELAEFPQSVIDRCVGNFWKSDEAKDYMYGRGFTDDTLITFKVGFSPANNYHPDVVTVPMHDYMGVPIGFIGRGIEGKVFKNSNQLPSSKTWFNLHRAKREGSTAILTEASFDAMRIHQAGFPGVVANLSGHVNATKMAWLDRYFERIIMATDFDTLQYNDKDDKQCKPCLSKGHSSCQGHNPGRDLALTVTKALPHKEVWWAWHSDGVVYPHGAKDIGDLTDEEIKHVINNAIPSSEYAGWDVY